MPSPPLAPDHDAIDIEHLRRMTLDDDGLEREVLAMFSAQSAGLIGKLKTLPSDAGALAHTLKGSARAIGAFGVAEAADRLERDSERRRPGPGARRTRRRRGAGPRRCRCDAAAVLIPRHLRSIAAGRALVRN